MSHRLTITSVWTILGVCASGCHRQPSGFERFIPEPGVARDAVAAVLEEWRKGGPSDSVTGSRPAVYIVDKQRRPGQVLTDHEILGEIAVENARCFAVRLKFEAPKETRVARFLVVGTDPLWVFRQEDYEMISHWMHPMNEPDDPAGEPEPTP